MRQSRSQFIPTSSTVSASSSSVSVAVRASLTKFWNSSSGTWRSAIVRIGLKLVPQLMSENVCEKCEILDLCEMLHTYFEGSVARQVRVGKFRNLRSTRFGIVEPKNPR